MLPFQVPISGARDLVLEISIYGQSFEPDLKEDVLDDLADIAARLDLDGEPDDLLLRHFDITGRFLWFLYYPNRRMIDELKRSELSRVLDTVGGLMMLDGPREIHATVLELSIEFDSRFMLRKTQI